MVVDYYADLSTNKSLMDLRFMRVLRLIISPLL